MMAARKAGCSGLLLESPEVLQVEAETSKLSRETLTITEVKQEAIVVRSPQVDLAIIVL